MTNWNYVLDIRDFGAKCDGKTDDADAVQAALKQVPLNAAVPGTPNPVCTVYIPPARVAISRSIRITSPGTILQGVGLCGGDNHQGSNAISTFVTLPGFHDAFALGWSPEYVNTRWGLVGYYGIPEVRGVTARNICVDVTATPYVTGFQVRSISNCPSWDECSVLGNAGYGFDFGMANVPNIPYSLPCEGLVLNNCYVYALMNNEGYAMNFQPVSPMFRFSGCNEVKVQCGKALLDCYSGKFPDNPVPAVLIESDVIPRADTDYGVVPGGGYSFDGFSTGNSRVHYEVRGIVHPLTGTYYRPSNLTWTSCILEGYETGLKLNKEILPSGVKDSTTWLSQNVSFNLSNSLRTPYGVQALNLDGDYIYSGELGYINLCRTPGAGVKLGRHTVDITVHGGITPNSMGESPYLINEGQNSNITYCPYTGMRP